MKFLYNSRGSLAEAVDYWLELLKERDKISNENYELYNKIANIASLKLQNFISAIYRAKDNTNNENK